MTVVPLKELPEFVRNVRAMLKLGPPPGRATILALEGNLGSGKTTFVQELARDMGVLEPVASPTYVLMKKYQLRGDRLSSGAPRRFRTLVHIDAYRLERPEEFAALRPEQFLSDPGTLVVVEWPEKLGKALPKPDLVVTFSSEGAEASERNIEVQTKVTQ